MKKKISAIILVFLLCFSLAAPVFATSSSGDRMVDLADVLTESEEKALRTVLDMVSKKQQVDVVIVTVKDLEGKSQMEYADDYFDENGYGFGSDRDGVLYLVRIESDGSYSKGNSWISTCGYGITAFTDAGIQYIGGEITDLLLEENYGEAFQQFVTLADDFITQAKNGEAYDSGNMPKEPFPLGGGILISLVVGLIVAFSVTRSMKKQLKSVRFQSGASSYLKRGSMKVTKQSDVFLYTHVDKVRRAERESSDSRGSSTHSSSSGTRHGGGGF